ncbi:MAG: tRNA lysidine(34) synthetase TilS [Dehalococcoidales bacterium]|nr:tRNA lysidine(34) synthetase TilS [Dehalococcoidales bacterium]
MSKKSNDSPEKKVLEYVRKNNLFENRGRIVVAVSGGPDSVCLLYILNSMREELGIELHIAHLNHKLRGEESDGDAAYVSGLAEELELDATIEERDVNEYRAEHGGTVEEAAREVRYRFLAEVAGKLGTDCVATGHTSNDNIETILHHLVRGTGTRGLRGLQPEITLNTVSGQVMVIRPLLGLSREETVAYCREKGLHPRQDSTNLSLSPLRNRIRQQLIPLLESYNEGIRDALLRTADTALDETDYLDGVVAGMWGSVVRQEENAVALDKKAFWGLHPAIRRHLLRRAVEAVTGTLKDIETRHITAMMEGFALQPGKELHLPEGLVFIVEYDRCILTRTPGELNPFPPLEGEYRLTIPGETSIPGWKIISTVSGSDIQIRSDDDYTAFFDLTKTGDTLVVRSRRTADRFQPLGTDYLKKVGEYMIDAKIPRSWRDSIPLVCSPDTVLWLAGYRMDDRVKVTPETEKVLRIEFRKV